MRLGTKLWTVSKIFSAVSVKVIRIWLGIVVSHGLRNLPTLRTLHTLLAAAHPVKESLPPGDASVGTDVSRPPDLSMDLNDSSEAPDARILDSQGLIVSPP